MAYVVVAEWTAQEGREARVRAALEALTGPSRAEPGCLYYQPTQDLANPRAFLVFEIYEDEDAYKAHGASEHFERYGLGEAIPLLERRERGFYETIDI